MKIHVSIAFYGNCEEAMNFYSQVFEKDLISINRYKEMPPSDDFKVEEKDYDKVMHSMLPISENILLMAYDDVMGVTKRGSATNLSIQLTKEEDLQKSKKLYEKLSEGGNVTMPYDKMFWDAYYCKFTDKYGIEWEINHEQ